MWKTDETDDQQMGLATWCEGESTWSLDVRGGEHGIRVLDGDSDELLRLATVGDETLPVIAEQFVRGNELHVWLPQSDGRYGVRIAWMPVMSGESCLVLEATISIETDLLDSHPTLDVIADCQSVSRAGDAGVSVARRESNSTSVLLGNHDSPFTSDQSTDQQVSLRLFGDFLEKGVIRVARPWFVLTNSAQAPSEMELENRLGQLNASPLPLAP